MNINPEGTLVVPHFMREHMGVRGITRVRANSICPAAFADAIMNTVVVEMPIAAPEFRMKINYAEVAIEAMASARYLGVVESVLCAAKFTFRFAVRFPAGSGVAPEVVAPLVSMAADTPNVFMIEVCGQRIDFADMTCLVPQRRLDDIYLNECTLHATLRPGPTLLDSMDWIGTLCMRGGALSPALGALLPTAAIGRLNLGECAMGPHLPGILGGAAACRALRTLEFSGDTQWDLIVRALADSLPSWQRPLEYLGLYPPDNFADLRPLMRALEGPNTVQNLTIAKPADARFYGDNAAAAVRMLRLNGTLRYFEMRLLVAGPETAEMLAAVEARGSPATLISICADDDGLCTYLSYRDLHVHTTSVTVGLPRRYVGSAARRIRERPRPVHCTALDMSRFNPCEDDGLVLHNDDTDWSFVARLPRTLRVLSIHSCPRIAL